jgi:tryptophan 2,3-dioxygenase
MSLIKPRTRGKQLVRHRTRLDRETNETLYAYAEFIGESTEYVINQAIDGVLAKDKEFVQWRAEHPSSFVPRGIARRRRGGRGSGGTPILPIAMTG